MQAAILVFVFIISTSGLVYELIAGTTASYILGDSVAQFSIVIGLYLFAMGCGSFLTRYVTRNIPLIFIRVEVLVGIVGGSSGAILFVFAEHITSFRLLLYTLVLLTGVLVGFEIPLLMRLLKDRLKFEELVSRVLALDYIGALLAALIFPLILVPRLGLIRSGLLFGALNTITALACLKVFPLQNARLIKLEAGIVLVLQVTGAIYSERILNFAEVAFYSEPVVHARSSPYQRIVITARGEEIRLYLNGNLQFSSRDEYRYHEALIHPGLSAVVRPKHVLILGGGDGLAAREVLRYSSVQTITLVDLDSAVTDLFSTHQRLRSLNSASLTSSKMKIVHEDALVWLQNNTQKFDFIAIDFPDPANFSTGKLYTDTMYRLLLSAMSQDCIVALQSTSPFFAPRSFWIIENTVRSVGLFTVPYHAYVPSFGEWGFLLASRKPLFLQNSFPMGLKFASPRTLEQMLDFPQDMRSAETEVNRLNNQILVRVFEGEWGRANNQ
ncbi:MAG: polyamine aminopropyltransferase [Leptospirales bacterium]|nr:polyamine aminopropyltransferase [Leptospirales bacterium]